MDSNFSPPRVAEAKLLPVWRTDASLDGRKAGGGESSAPPASVEKPPAPEPPPEPAKLRVEFDAQSGRFIQTLLDPKTNEVLAVYPTESQLAFSRAISAYVKAVQSD